MSADWSALNDTLDRLASRGTPAKLWVRDDDAISDTEPLRQLDQWASDAQAQILLAIVPSKADASLALRLDKARHFIGAVHGWAHQNHAPQTEKKQELGAHRPIETICSELAEAQRQIKELTDERCLPVLVPPWNRIAPDVVQRLPALGYTGLSTFAEAFCEPAVPGLQVQNSHVDIIDWRGTRGGRPMPDLIGELILKVEERAPTSQPIGILTHHLVHDAAAWSFLEGLSTVVASHAGADWLSPQELFLA